jgi:Predicted oxidoreductases (related to aryl-alcohol dehydrogenases)
MIHHRTLGRTGLKVSQLSLGTMNFGWRTDEATSFAILDTFYAAGGNFLQAAAILPALTLPTISTRASEEIIGRWMTSRRIPRRNLVLGTRVNVRPPRTTGMNLGQLVRERVNDSLRRLNTDYLDLLIFEWNDRLLPIERALEAFDVAIRQCYVRYIGAANFPTWRVLDSIAVAFRRNQPRMEVLQGDYSLMQRARFEPEAMSLCDERKLGFIASSPLARGFLTRKPTRASELIASPRQWLHRRFENNYGDAALAALDEVAARHNASFAQVALAWVLANRTVTSALVGVRSAAELQELIHGAELRLSLADLHQLSAATAAEEVLVPADFLLGRHNRTEVLAN